jgi:hypothetical protein
MALTVSFINFVTSASERTLFPLGSIRVNTSLRALRYGGRGGHHGGDEYGSVTLRKCTSCVAGDDFMQECTLSNNNRGPY